MYKYILFDNFNNELKKLWTSIELDNNFSVFQSYEWNLNWYKNIASKNKAIKLCILVVKYETRVTDIFPFCIRKHNFLKILEFLGGLNTDYMMPLFTYESIMYGNHLDSKKFSKFLNSNLPKYDIAIFKNQVEFYNNSENIFLRFFKKKETSISHRIIFNKRKVEEYLKQDVNKRFYNDLKRQIKRLKKIDKLSFIVANSFEDQTILIKKMIEQKYIKYELTGFNMFKSNNFQNLYLDCKNNLGSLGSKHVSALKLGGNLIAVHFGFISKKSLLYIMPSYDKKWQRYSPGNVLIYYLIKYCLDNDIESFDFTDGDNFYKQKWSNFNCIIFESSFTVTILGYLYSVFYIFKTKLKNVIFIRNLYRYLKNRL